MSQPLSSLPFRRVIARTVVAALLLAALLTGLPWAVSHLPAPVNSVAAPALQAGSPSGGTCG